MKSIENNFISPFKKKIHLNDELINSHTHFYCLGDNKDLTDDLIKEIYSKLIREINRERISLENGVFFLIA
jgi:hypothetical protein